MGTIRDSELVRASLAETWDHYFDARGWPSWVDGFGAVETSDGYPEPGARLTWRSNPSGRGRVSERVLEHEPRARHRIEFADPESSGELTTTFTMEGDATRVAVVFAYRLAKGGAFAAITDRLFVRGQVSQSVRRTLERFKHEVEELAAIEGENVT